MDVEGRLLVDVLVGGAGVVEVEEEEVRVEVEGLLDEREHFVEVDLSRLVDFDVGVGEFLFAVQPHPYSYILQSLLVKHYIISDLPSFTFMSNAIFHKL